MRRLAFVAIAGTLALPDIAGAQETRASVDVSATGGYSSNPFAETGGGTGQGFAALDVAPELRLLTERNTYTISGQAHVQEYTSRYPTTDSYRVSFDWRGRLSSRLTTFAHLDLSSSVLGADDQYAVGNVFVPGAGGGLTPVGGTSGTTGTSGAGTTTPTTGATVPTAGFSDPGTGPLISDIGLLGTRDRRRSLYATAGGTEVLSAHDALSFSGFVDVARYSRFGDLSDYNGYGGTLGYSRQVSGHFHAGVQGSASAYDYRGVQGTTNVYSIQATGSGQLGQRWTVDGALGVSFIRTDTPGSSDRPSLSGNINLCRAGEYDTLCAQLSRQARATGYNGAQFVTTAGADWRHRLGVRSNLSLDGAYVQEGGLANLGGRQDQYLRLSATYARQLRQRLNLLVSGRYRQIFGGGFDRQADYGGQVGFTYHFGQFR